MYPSGTLFPKSHAEKVVKAKKEKTTKTCPYCLSEIPIKATKCAHCTSDLEEVNTTKKSNKKSDK